MFQYIIKRNEERVPFQQERITEAIFKSLHAAGSPDWKTAQTISNQVTARLKELYAKRVGVKVEEIQDVVESVLIEQGLAKVAKHYILYRQHRAAIRVEKSQVLNKEEIDEVDKKFDVNALRVLAARYLKKNDEGKIVESPHELFVRVSVHTTLPSLFYDKRVFSKKPKKVSSYQPVVLTSIDAKKKLYIGKYELNEFHKEAVVRLYNLFAKKGHMKVPFRSIVAMLSHNEFNNHEAEIDGYYQALTRRQFVCNTPALANFGNYLGMGSACFVLGVKDSIDDIMEKLKSASIIFKAGGGVGYNFSHLRPEGDFVKTTGGVASGPISFMQLFDTMTDVIKQGGIRRGANMGIINSNHPDIMKFIKAKEGNKALRNFNISVYLTDDFWDYYHSKKPYPLINPRSGKIHSYIDAQQLFDALVYQAWESAEPGVIFADHVNEYNPFLKHLGPIETTNPCGEVLLYPYESCNLGSINVWAFVKGKNGSKPHMDWDGLREAVILGTRFLDNVTDVNKYPLPEIEEMTHFTRKIGLGVMGVADALYELELPYNGKAGLDFMEQLMEFVNYYSKVESIELAKERGVLPSFNQSFYKEGRLPIAGFADKKSWHFDWNKVSQDVKKYGIRNGYTTVIAPTGSISMIAGCSSGIEPVYSLVFEKHVAVGNFYYTDPVFEANMQSEGLMDSDLIKDVAAHKGSVARLSYIPEKLKKVFVTAHDITPSDHIKALAAFQKWVDSSISKTNNFPADATPEDVREAYELAYKLGCKDVTVYRDGSIDGQVLVSDGGKDKKNPKEPIVKKQEKEGSSLVTMKDEKAKGMGVYKEAAVHENGNSLGLSPAMVSYKKGDAPEAKITTVENGDSVDFNGVVKCKLCNL
jgi:ribonucleoside-diphosphate reductase alpha chain